MPKRFSCPLCPQNNFSSATAVVEHLKKHHVGKLSRQSFEYLLSNGVSAEKIAEWCRKNGVEIELRQQVSLEVFV